MEHLQLRFQHGGAYRSDIQNIRRAVRANGTKVNCVKIPITHNSAPNCKLSFYVNMAYQPNSSFPNADASLYTVAFSNEADRIFSFKVKVPLNTQSASKDITKLTEDGSYRSLGCAQGPFPEIKGDNLEAAVRKVSAHNGLHLDRSVREALMRLIIAVNEAVRFEDIEKGVSLALAPKAPVYPPPWSLIHSWGAHHLPS